VYHNITPHTFFVGVNPLYAQAARVGRDQLGVLRGLTEAGWGDSAFDCEELAEKGWVRLGVLPIVFEPRRYAVRPDRGVLQELRQGFTVLSVGRLAPNKRLQDLLLVHYYLKRLVRSDARLVLVGSGVGMEPYVAFLKALLARLNLRDVVFAGHVSMSQLVAYYRRAGVYLSMSAHEGFGVPLLESAHFGVPVVAYKAGAVPDTLAGSGVLITARDYQAVAELLGLLAEDQDLRGQLVAHQRERAADFTPERVAERLQTLLYDLGI
jgi:glycosyltransferase involved in cell wall biosynthesis